MSTFDPQDPFPFFTDRELSYSEAQAHSTAVDRWLGLETENVEAEIAKTYPPVSEEDNLWIGLPAHALLTPYTEFRQILERLKPAAGQTVVDLGAAYGRMGFVIEKHFPQVAFVGYEKVRERVVEGQRCLPTTPRIRLLEADLADLEFRPVPAEFYFLYDFGSRRAIQKTLDDLLEVALKRDICVVGRGRAVRDAIERKTPWLSQVHRPEHFAHYSIYRSVYRS